MLLDGYTQNNPTTDQVVSAISKLVQKEPRIRNIWCFSSESTRAENLSFSGLYLTR